MKLKIKKKYLDAIRQGKKTFEVRSGDLEVKEGDVITLKCVETGEEVKVRVKYVLKTTELSEFYGWKAGDLTIFSIEVVG